MQMKLHQLRNTLYILHILLVCSIILILFLKLQAPKVWVVCIYYAAKIIQ